MELIKLENEIFTLDTETSKKLAEFERMAKKIKEEQDNIKQMILEEMEAKNILKIDTDEITISYVAPTDRESFDSKTFKSEHQEMYDEYVKMTPVKSSIRLKVK